MACDLDFRDRAGAVLWLLPRPAYLYVRARKLAACTRSRCPLRARLCGTAEAVVGGTATHGSRLVKLKPARRLSRLPFGEDGAVVSNDPRVPVRMRSLHARLLAAAILLTHAQPRMQRVATSGISGSRGMPTWAVLCRTIRISKRNPDRKGEPRPEPARRLSRLRDDRE